MNTWKVVDTHDEDSKIIIWDGDEQAHTPICDMGEIGEINYAETLKNAKLIAAAPKLLGALENAINGLEWRRDEPDYKFDKADDEKLYEWKKIISEIQ